VTAAVSVVVPVHGNAAFLPELHRRLSDSIAGELLEILFVDDASPDDSLAVMRRLAEADSRIRTVALPRNRGQHEAVLCGMRRAQGQWVVSLDADLQDPPEAIPALLEEGRRGPDVVFAGRRGRYESLPRLASSRAFKRTLAAASGVPRDAGMFFAANRTAVARVLALSGPPPFVVAMFGRCGLQLTSVPVMRASSNGRSAYSLHGRLRSAMRGLRWALRRPANAPSDSDGRARHLADHNAAQRAYYRRGKRGMAPRHSRYLERHLDELVAFANIRAGARVLEVGPGQGRYTLPLADRGFRVEAIELSPAMLALLSEARGERPIELHHGDILDPPASISAGFDAVIGLFTLHHLHDVAACIGSMADLLAPGGTLAFVEPNPYNPLYYVQMALRPSMTWEGDKGMLEMRPGPLLHAVEAAGLEQPRFERFGFFPPFVADRPRAAGIERALERIPPLRPVLPFQLVGGRKTATS
jgi:glycosyltransferase involved in cell wall biosynthesis